MCHAWMNPQLLCRRVCEGVQERREGPSASADTEDGAPDTGCLRQASFLDGKCWLYQSLLVSPGPGTVPSTSWVFSKRSREGQEGGREGFLI